MFLTSVLIRIYSSSKDSTGVEYIFDFTCSHKKKSHGVQLRDRCGHGIGPRLPIQLPDYLLFKYDFTRVKK